MWFSLSQSESQKRDCQRKLYTHSRVYYGRNEVDGAKGFSLGYQAVWYRTQEDFLVTILLFTGNPFKVTWRRYNVRAGNRYRWECRWNIVDE